ncbi:MAG: hypothetical protein ACI9N1_002911 [Flavobacteriales bacterium]|jgi:hypothetical protein
MLMLYVSFINGQDKAKPNMKLEVSASINNHYKFQNVQVGYGLAFGTLKERSSRVGRYLGLEFNKSFNPIERYIYNYHKPTASGTSVDIDNLYFLDLLIPFFMKYQS